MQGIIDVLGRDHLYPHPETLVTFFGNHDQTRFISEKGSSPAKLKAAFSLLLTMRGIPQIYSGDEIGMLGGADPDNRRDFPGGFPSDPRNAFSSSGRTSEQQDIFAHVQSLLAQRQAHPALRTGKQWHIGWDDSYYAFLRQLPEEKLLIVYNNAGSARDLRIPLDDTPLETAQELHSLFGELRLGFNSARWKSNSGLSQSRYSKYDESCHVLNAPGTLRISLVRLGSVSSLCGHKHQGFDRAD